MQHYGGVHLFLKRLEVYGFKSFADKTELAFTNGITAIVGPNGSGKSNVGDAVRWVLGEQSAKQLRGGKMEDIIFNGTEKRKKLSFCEVTLVFDNQDRALPIDYTEVAITRRLYRSGESEYCINRTPCRLKDVTELLMDTGIGKEGYSIIGQGKIDNILSNKAEERRSVFEEAAGIMKYKTRKLEAERRLERTSENMSRLNDILSELSDRIGPLELQSQTAQKYLALREELRTLEVNFYLYQYDMAAKRKEEIKGAMEAVEGEYAEKERLRDELQTAQEGSRSDVEKIEEELSQLHGRMLALTAQIEQGTGQNKIYCERVEHLNREAERLEQENDGAEKTIRELSLSGGNKELIAEKEKEAGQLKAAAEAGQTELDNKDAALETEERELERLRGELIEAMNRLSGERVNAGRCEAMKASIAERIEQINAQSTVLSGELESIAQARKDRQQAGQALAQEYERLSGARQQAKASFEEITRKKETLAAEAQRTAEQLQAAAQKASMLREMKRDYESFNNAVKHLLTDCQKNPALAECSRGVVAELITVPEKFERAVETALGAAVQNIVTPTEEDAKRLIEYLKKCGYGRATFLPMSAIKARRADNAERAALRVPGCFGIASELISFDNQYRAIMESLLGRTVICDKMDTCISIARACGHSLKLVTLDGDIINPGGSMTGGSRQSRLTSVLGRTRELEEAERLHEELLVKKESLRARSAELAQQLRAASETLEEANAQMHKTEVEIAAENEKLKRLDGDRDSRFRSLEDLETEKKQHNDTLLDIEAQLSGADGKAEALEEDNKSAQRTLSQRTAAYNAEKLAREKTAQELTELKVRMTAAFSELAAMHSDAQRVNREIERLAGVKEHNIGKINDCRRQIEELDRESVAGGKMVEKLKKELEQVSGQGETLEKSKSELADISQERQRRMRELEKDIGNAQEKKHRFELSLQKVDADISLMEQRVWDEYELTYTNALQMRIPDFRPNGVQGDITRLRKAIGALGNVNVNAIEEYADTKTRYEELTRQLEDLEKAERDLNKIIVDMMKKMESRFAEQFAVINKYFGETFKKLFGGGRAELRLENAGDVLGSGIDIVAQPPGKSLQMLSLLSGGERALTAIAILFAMLRLKPTPFCILDEIEAALDEANVYNFAGYLREFTQKTQFIVITHRKPTMEEADSLYGVAMEEKGVSRMVSVRLTDVEA